MERSSNTLATSLTESMKYFTKAIVHSEDKKLEAAREKMISDQVAAFIQKGEFDKARQYKELREGPGGEGMRGSPWRRRRGWLVLREQRGRLPIPGERGWLVTREQRGWLHLREEGGRLHMNRLRRGAMWRTPMMCL